MQKWSETTESQKEVHRVQAEERLRQDHQFIRAQWLKQNWDFLSWSSREKFNVMEELKKFQSSTFGAVARGRLVEDQDTILEFTGKIQELQNEIYCINDSKDFQDVQSVRSGYSLVTSQPVFVPFHPILGGKLSRSVGMPSRKNGPPSIWNTHGRSGNVKSSCVLFSTLSAGIESMEFRNRRTDSFINGGKEWETNRSSRLEMPVWTVSQKFCQRIMEQTSNRIQIFIATNSQIQHRLLLEDKIQDWGMYMFTNSHGSCALDQRSGDGWISGWSKIFVFSKRNSNA